MRPVTIGPSALECEINKIPGLKDEYVRTLDRLTKTLIGAGIRKDNLYHFMPIPNVSQVAATMSLATHYWHERMGHPSDDESINNACDDPNDSTDTSIMTINPNLSTNEPLNSQTNPPTDQGNEEGRGCRIKFSPT
ncbi:hypothetical protein V2J09_022534 [Rumex salicifolius]